ncbi:MAG: toll/interleukin-1 receptor domain-containing protein [Gallionella sp.]|jgi:hypothetical protein|nr:toll/interleukin-1 receptor domain-containing protein [Gallionella sp.]
MSTPLYQCLIFGAPSPEQIATFESRLTASLNEFCLQRDLHFSIAQGIKADFEATVPTVAVFFGGAGTTLPEHAQLMRLSIPVVPLVSSVSTVSVELPECLRAINALVLDAQDRELVKPVGATLQCLGLLPSQRRVFISYRRNESRDIATQLFEALSARQFDVFLDTHSVAAAVDFQTMLWHRLCDSDVVVMLDTPGFFESRWTRAEWGRATDKHISILQVLWPGRAASRSSQLATPMLLDNTDLVSGRLTDRIVDQLALKVEALRSKSTALRHANIAGHLRSALECIGGSVAGMGVRRSLIMKLPSGSELVAYPSVGVPTAVTLHEAVRDANNRAAILVYDHVGLSDEWMTHLDWLGANFTAVKWIKSRQAGWELAELEGL